MFPFSAGAEEANSTLLADPEPEKRELAKIDLTLSETFVFSDNIYATQNDKADDFIFVTQPTAKLEIANKSNSLVIRGEGEIARYASNENENFEDWLVSGDIRSRISKSILLIAGAEYRWEHENRTSPDDANGVEPTQYERGFAYAGALLRRGKAFARVGGTLEAYAFDDTAVVSGVLNNIDRDRLQYELGVRAGYDPAKNLSLFIQGAYDKREYDQTVDDFGFNRDSDGYSVAAGLRRNFSQSLSGEIFAGLLRQDFDDPQLKDISTFDIGAQLDWKAPKALSGSIRLDRRIEETTLPGSSAYILTNGSINLTASPHPRILGGLGISGSHYDYEGVDRSEFIASANAWSQYWLTRRLFVGVDYIFSQRTSNAAGFDFNENRVMARIGARLSPRSFDTAGPLPDFNGAAAPGGAYGYAFGAFGALATGLEGPRGSGDNVADFGDVGFNYGGALGYGFVADQLYLGIEVEGTLEGPEWLHESGREFSAYRANGFGGGFRIGYITDDANLIYTRFSVLSSEFVTKYAYAGEYFEVHERKRGLGFGLGAEVNGGGHAFLRAEYAVGAYDDYDIATGPSTFDNFSNFDSQFRIGAGLRTGAARETGNGATDFSGPYVGLQLGHGSLVSENAGIRSGGTLLDVTRGGHGPLIGAFAGVGTVISRLYLGAEVDVDVSDIDWNIERDPTGRVYSAEHEFSFGAGARFGVLVGDSALAYSRIGAVRTRFNTDFATTSTAVESRLTRTGLRYGGGIETALTPKSRLRLDYTYTHYNEYGVSYGQSVDTFENSEVLFRLGFIRAL